MYTRVIRGLKMTNLAKSVMFVPFQSFCEESIKKFFIHFFQIWCQRILSESWKGWRMRRKRNRPLYHLSELSLTWFYSKFYCCCRNPMKFLFFNNLVFLKIELFLTHPKLGKRRRRILKTKLMLDFSFHQDEVHRKTYSWLPSFSFCGWKLLYNLNLPVVSSVEVYS